MKLTDEAAKEMLEMLSEHYKEPVLPMSKYCEAFRIWAKCYSKINPDMRNAISSIRIDIEKSNLLARLLYGGEKFRTKECPIHKGVWNGQAMLMGCPHDCDGTGWLKENRIETSI